ncbi:GTP pyrophosphokinase [Bacteroidia bacterium]|nr:GTP pyrophosphokinase [Bacteroidia bacterium]GHT51152.1 GTP pyrophosphokinase [Bacteroidia bacterium]
MKELEDDQVQKAYEALLDSYGRSNHRKKFEIINKAFKFADQAHKGVKRRSGEPYIMHPLAVALVVSEEMGLGSTSISAALLHDVVEDTDYSVEDIKNLFGEKIAQIVDGLTKMSGGIFAEAASAQAENMRKLLLTMSDDIRVILIKLADRLHNMRTLGSLLPAKQYKIAGETMYLYAPMAHRLGLFAIKSELEDLSFKYEHPEEYKQIEQKLTATAANRERIYEHFADPLQESLNQLGYQYKMQERVKSIYSIWNKMQSKNVNFEDIYDIFAVRIVFEPKPDMDVKKQCWEIYSAITDLYILRPDRIRDWISHPKANGYQALHLTVMGPDGQWIEVQIRSTKMDEIAEKGFAAHWKYKEHGIDKDIQEQTELDHWLARIQDILEAPSPNAMDFLDTIKLNLYSSEIFVFTPKGEIKTLPQNATALDFAYEIHTKIGDHCIGAKANHKLVPLSHKLSSGDQVEILTSRSQHPQEEWLSFVTTAKAKTKIESSLKKQRKEKIKEGEDLLTEILQKAGIEITIPIWDKFCSFYGYSKKEDLFYAFAKKQIELPENPLKVLKEKTDNFFVRYMKQAFNAVNPTKEESEKPVENQPETDMNQIDRKKTYTLKEEDFQKNFITHDCCRPIPGDDVFGFIRDDGRLEVHKRSCQPALKLKTRYGDRIVSCDWAGHKTFSFPATIEIKGIDRMGVLNDITQVITNDLSVNMHKLTIESKDGFFEGRIEVAIHDVDDINNLSSRLQKIKGIKNVVRIDD